MTTYMISFPSSAMGLSETDLQALSDAAHALVEEAKAAGVHVFGGGINEAVPPVKVSADGAVVEGTYPEPAGSRAVAPFSDCPRERRPKHGP